MDKIIDEEEGRIVPPSKKNKSYPDYSTFCAWLSELGVDSRFMYDSNWKKMISGGKKIQRAVVSKTIKKAEKNEKLTYALKQVSKYLGETDQIRRADVVIVFGSQDLGRIEKAVELKKKGLVDKIIVSGKARYDAKGNGITESQAFKERAVELGISKKDIIIEKTALTVGSNVRHSLNRLDEAGIKYKSIMTMIAWFAQRRTWCHLMKYTEKIDIVRVNSNIPDDRPLSIKNWYKNELGLNSIYGEFLKMRMAVILGTA